MGAPDSTAAAGDRRAARLESGGAQPLASLADSEREQLVEGEQQGDHDHPHDDGRRHRGFRRHKLLFVALEVGGVLFERECLAPLRVALEALPDAVAE